MAKLVAVSSRSIEIDSVKVDNVYDSRLRFARKLNSVRLRPADCGGVNRRAFYFQCSRKLHGLHQIPPQRGIKLLGKRLLSTADCLTVPGHFVFIEKSHPIGQAFATSEGGPR